MKVSTSAFRGQKDILARCAPLARCPARKIMALRAYCTMLVRMYVLYVRRERGLSAAMASMDKDTLNQTPEYVYVRFPRAFLHLEPF